MAAVYLHNAIHSRNPSVPADILEHSRNISTVSGTTLFTNTTSHSQPSEPLLHSLPPGAAAVSYFDQLSRQPCRSDDTPPHLRWDDRLSLKTESKVVGERRERKWSGNVGQAFRGRQRIKVVWESIIATWAAFNTVRYFIAFAVYGEDSSAGQSFCLALGTSTGIAFALFLCSQVLAVVNHHIRSNVQVMKYLPYIRHSLHFLTSLCIFGPAVVNFVLTFIWRQSSNQRYNIKHRCHIDIDIVWSATHNLCTNEFSPWGVWITLSAVRLVLTFIILVAYHTFSFIYPDIPQRPLHHRLRSESYASTLLSPDGDYSSSTAMVSPRTVNHDGRIQHQRSDPTLAESYRPPSRLGHTRSYSSGMLGDENSGEILMHAALPDTEHEREDRHQALLAQIAQETDDALKYALGPRSQEIPPSPPPSGLPPSYSRNDHNSNYESDDDDAEYRARLQARHDNHFDLPPIPPALGYNEFGLPYPPDQPVRMLNAFIKRMPTIESMGSGEVGTSIGASSNPARDGSMYTSSRPPTRNTLLSFCSTDYDAPGSRPPSRPSSLSARAELMAGMSNTNSNNQLQLLTSEHGELLSGSTTKRMASPTSYLECPASPTHADAVSTAGSRATTTMSYHTATTGSSGDFHPPISPISTVSKESAQHSHEY